MQQCLLLKFGTDFFYSKFSTVHQFLVSENLFFSSPFLCVIMADKFTVVSFLEALEDSVDKAGSSSSAGDKDAEPKQGGGNDPMDES